MKLFAYLGVATALLVAPAFAGQCPADQVGADVTPPGPSENAGVTLEVLAEVDLGPVYEIENRHLRMRRVTVAPGGVFAWHNHAERPGVVTVISGEMTEYRSDCRVPIVHSAGEGTTEAGVLYHWWKNNGAEPAVLVSADLPVMNAAH